MVPSDEQDTNPHKHLKWRRKIVDVIYPFCIKKYVYILSNKCFIKSIKKYTIPKTNTPSQKTNTPSQIQNNPPQIQINIPNTRYTIPNTNTTSQIQNTPSQLSNTPSQVQNFVTPNTIPICSLPAWLLWSLELGLLSLKVWKSPKVGEVGFDFFIRLWYKSYSALQWREVDPPL